MAPLLCAPPRKVHPSEKLVGDGALKRFIGSTLNHFRQLLVKDFFALFCWDFRST